MSSETTCLNVYGTSVSLHIIQEDTQLATEHMAYQRRTL